MAVSKSAKIWAEMEKVKAKINEQQARLKELEQKHREAENEEIVDIVRAAVLPLDPVLEAALTAPSPVETRDCPLCGRPALLTGRRRYCSPACAQAAHRKQQRDHMRKKRG